MKFRSLKSLLLATGLSLSAAAALGAGYWTNGIPVLPTPLTGNETIPMDTNLPAGQTPQSSAVNTALLANMSGLPRNYLDNGSMNVQQRGTGTVTCGTTTIPSTAYGPDRWGCNANVTSGAGRMALVTTAALLPTGFQNVNTLFRTSGALVQPICSMQEIPSTESTALAGKTVSLSFWAAALAGLSADNGNIITASIFTGTGSDQGLGTFTASPAVTPAWTGIATPVNQTPITITTTPTRYYVSGAIPATATEAAVAICFTPTATGAGATDGFAFTGVQLEVAPQPTAYEFHTVGFDLNRAQRFFWQISDPAATVVINSSCFVTAANTTVKCGVALPVQMRAAPTTTISTATSFGIIVTAGTAGTCTTLAATASSNTVTDIGVTCTTGGTIALGSATPLIGAATAGTLSASADF